MEREMCPVVKKEVVRDHLGHRGYVCDKTVGYSMISNDK